MSRCFSEMSNLLVDFGYSVTAICFDKIQGNPGFPIDKKVKFVNACNGIPLANKSIIKNLRSLSLNRELRHAKRSLIDLNLIEQRVKILLNDSPVVDLFISFQPESTYILEKIKEKIGLRAPTITMLHSTPKEVFGRPVFTYIREYVSKSQAIQVLCSEFVPEVEAVFPNVPIKVIPNFVGDCYGVADYSKKKIICVSRIVPGKRIHLLVEAFAIIQSGFSDWVVEVYGELERDKEYTQKIRNLISKYNLEEIFILKGTTDNIAKVLSDSSIFAFPTSFDGFSVALIEAMATGLPTIACRDCPSVNKVVMDNVTGFLTASTPQAVALALEKLMNSLDLRHKFGAIARIEAKKYSRERVGAEWNALVTYVNNNSFKWENVIK